MANYQVFKFDKFSDKWVLAWGLKPRSFLRADGVNENCDEKAIDKFIADTKRCKMNLLLVRFADFGTGRHILHEINGEQDLDKLAVEIQEGSHPKLLELIQERKPLTSFDCGTTDEQVNAIKHALLESVYPNERVKLVG
ncbi:hypothetical protein [Vibrio cholerae]|uniref:hypothetical protein n=1 Tax=Vibrio cholerae TaxID=666 RepID=UPI0012EB2528|nr:hypothetical protein [Vibrio cholerae]MDX5050028.1 hypothetical protein [Vibrio cholerae]MVC37296.1 hypothetical protein [Vibrio cholerae]MVF55154.1 hypothetical protein [Vibrio cholerae]HAU9839315.1 hypothetical protein [Vibrio cholerae O1]